MSFDAGSIIAHAEIRQDQFNRDLDAMQARAERFERGPHRIRITAEMQQSDLTRARQQLDRFDSQLYRDAVQRQRSGRGILAGLFGRVASGGAAGATLFGGLVGAGGAGASAQTEQAVRSAMNRMDQQLTSDARNRAALLARAGAAGIGGGTGGQGFFRGLAGGIGPNILGMGTRMSGILGLGGSALGALPALAGGLGALGIGGIGLGAAGLLVRGATSGISPLMQLQSQIQQARATATTPAQRAQIAQQQAGLTQAVGQLTPAQQQMFHALTSMQTWWQNFTKSMTPTIAKALSGVAGVFHSLEPEITGFFRSALTLALPVIRGLGDLAHMVLPDLSQAFRIVGPLMRPFLDGLGGLLHGVLSGLLPLLRAVSPAVRVLQQALSLIGRDLGAMFRDFAPVVSQSSVILKSLLAVLAAILPIVGQLAAIFARALAPVFSVFAGTIKALLPVLTIVGHVLSELAAAILGDLATAFSALAHLLRDISPSLQILAGVLGSVFKTMENSGVFAVLGDALEGAVRPLASLINALVRGLAPILPLLIGLVSSLAGTAIHLLITALQVLVPIAIELVNDVLRPLLPAIQALVPVITVLGQALGTGLGAVLRAIAPVLRVLAPWILGIVVAIKAWAIAQAILNIALDANPIGAIVLAVAGLVVGITLLVTHWRAVWSAIRSVASAAWNFIYNGFGKFLLPLLGPVGLIGLAAVELAQHWHTIWGDITRVAGGFWTFIQSWALRIDILFAGWARNILHYAQDAFGWLPNFLPGVSGIKSGLDSAQRDLGNFVSSTQSQLAALTNKQYPLKFVVKLPPGAVTNTPGAKSGGSPGRPQFAAGTGPRGAPPGWAWVGERGPELVSFGGGETVLSHPASMSVSRGFAAGTGILTVHLSRPSVNAIAGTLGSIVHSAVSSIQSRYVVPVTMPAAGGGGGFGGHGVVPTGPIQAYARRLVGAIWPGLGQWLAFADVVNRESGWNVSATNPTSGAYGIPQALPAGKMASAGPDWRTNPFTQIRWMVGYIRSRWIDPIRADFNERMAHWYDGGGWLMPGATVAVNQTGMREAVITPAQSHAFTMLAQAAEGMVGQRSGALTKRQIAEVVNIMLPEGTTVAQAMQELIFRMRVAEQQGFAGVLPGG